MGDAQGTIGEPPADDNDLDIRVVVANVVADLLQTT
jgi:hypothetical protein